MGSISKRFIEFKGVFSRASDLLRPDDYFSDALNVIISRRFSIRKRNGSVNVAIGHGGNGLVNYNGNTSLIGIDSGVWDVSTGAWVSKINAGQNTIDTTNRCSFAQNNQVLYFSNGINNVMKYDGLSWYRAGCPNSNYSLLYNFSPNDGAAGLIHYEVITQFVSTDLQGNVIEGGIASIPTASGYTANDYLEYTDTTTAFIVQFIPTLFWANLPAQPKKWAQGTAYVANTSYVMAPDSSIYVCKTNHTSTNTGGGNSLVDFQKDYSADKWTIVFADPCGFNNRFAVVNGAQSAVNTVTVFKGHGFVVGDKIFVRQTPGYIADFNSQASTGADLPIFDNWRSVTGVTATTVTFGGIPVNFFDHESISTNLTVRFYRRVRGTTTLFTQFLELGVGSGSDDGAGNQVASVTMLATIPISIYISGGDAINPTFPRGVPPRGRYIYIFQNLLFITGDPNAPHFVYWSNTENIESFPVGFNSQIIGDNTDGYISGIISNNGYLIVFKTKSIYFMSGAIADTNYSVQKVMATILGCTSHFSLKEINGKVFFLDYTGIYHISGGGIPMELSGNIKEKIVDDATGLDKTKAIAVVDSNFHHYKLFIPAFTGAVTNTNSRIFLWDYDNEAWWIHDTLDFTGGVDLFNNIVYFTRKDAAVTTQKEQTTYADAGVAISAYVKTHWYSFNEPSVPKKFDDYKIYALDGSNFTLRVQSEKDWVAGTYFTDFNLVFDASTRFAKNNAVAKHERAMRLTFSNSTLNENLEITGIEFEYEAPWKESMKR